MEGKRGRWLLPMNGSISSKSFEIDLKAFPVDPDTHHPEYPAVSCLRQEHAVEDTPGRCNCLGMIVMILLTPDANIGKSNSLCVKVHRGEHRSNI